MNYETNIFPLFYRNYDVLFVISCVLILNNVSITVNTAHACFSMPFEWVIAVIIGWINLVIQCIEIELSCFCLWRKRKCNQRPRRTIATCSWETRWRTTKKTGRTQTTSNSVSITRYVYIHYPMDIIGVYINRISFFISGTGGTKVSRTKRGGKAETFRWNAFTRFWKATTSGRKKKTIVRSRARKTRRYAKKKSSNYKIKITSLRAPIVCI